jgi:hypothetical protein
MIVANERETQALDVSVLQRRVVAWSGHRDFHEDSRRGERSRS